MRKRDEQYLKLYPIYYNVQPGHCLIILPSDSSNFVRWFTILGPIIKSTSSSSKNFSPHSLHSHLCQYSQYSYYTHKSHPSQNSYSSYSSVTVSWKIVVFVEATSSWMELQREMKKRKVKERIDKAGWERVEKEKQKAKIKTSVYS